MSQSTICAGSASLELVEVVTEGAVEVKQLVRRWELPDGVKKGTYVKMDLGEEELRADAPTATRVRFEAVGDSMEAHCSLEFDNARDCDSFFQLFDREWKQAHDELASYMDTKAGQEGTEGE